jgi:hypothetical protein
MRYGHGARMHKHSKMGHTNTRGGKIKPKTRRTARRVSSRG